MGRLTKDPELRHTPNNTPVAGFSIAVERSYSKDKAKITDFFDIVCWQSRAEFVSRNFKKGQLICVEGKLQRREWKDKEGSTRYTYEVIADSVHFAGFNKNTGQPGNPADFDPFEVAAA
jgi:single-strand DNA-binding protein